MILVLPFLLWSFLFPSLSFCYYSFLTCYTCLSPNGLKGKGCIFFSLPCLTYKCGNEHYIWNVFWTLWWFSVLHLCKHFVFSPAVNWPPLLDLLSLNLSVCCSFLCRRAEMGSFESICFTLIYFLQSHITPGLDSHCLLHTLAPTTWGYRWFSSCSLSLSLSEERGFSLESCTWFLKKLKVVTATAWEGARGCVAPWQPLTGTAKPLRKMTTGWHLPGTPLQIRTFWLGLSVVV